jgi:hypothetical protein
MRFVLVSVLVLHESIPSNAELALQVQGGTAPDAALQYSIAAIRVLLKTAQPTWYPHQHRREQKRSPILPRQWMLRLSAPVLPASSAVAAMRDAWQVLMLPACSSS